MEVTNFAPCIGWGVQEKMLHAKLEIFYPSRHGKNLSPALMNMYLEYPRQEPVEPPICYQPQQDAGTPCPKYGSGIIEPYIIKTKENLKVKCLNPFLPTS